MIEDIASWAIIIGLFLGAIWIFVPGVDGWGYRVGGVPTLAVLSLRLISCAFLAGRIFLAILLMRAVSRTPDGSYWFFFVSSVGVYLLYAFRLTLYLGDTKVKF